MVSRVVAGQVPLAMEFSKQEYWSGFPSPEDLPDPGIEPMSPASPALVGGFFYCCATWEAPLSCESAFISLYTLVNVYSCPCRYLFGSSHEWHLIVVLVCISLVANNVEHFFVCLLVSCMSSMKKCLFLMPIFKLGCFSFYFQL